MNEPAESGARNSALTTDNEPTPVGTVVRTFVICNKKGLHARASAKFVQTVEKFDAEVRVKRNGDTVGGTSIMGLMMLAAAPGTAITVEATGPQAADVVAALAVLIDSRFGEAD
jgi:phosphocarrier protein HPr